MNACCFKGDEGKHIGYLCLGKFRTVPVTATKAITDRSTKLFKKA